MRGKMHQSPRVCRTRSAKTYLIAVGFDPPQKQKHRIGEKRSRPVAESPNPGSHSPAELQEENIKGELDETWMESN